MSIFKENKHSIFVHCHLGEALSEIILWGEAGWWPKNSLMRFVRCGTGLVKEGTPRKNPSGIVRGTRYKQEVLLPFAPSWEVKVEQIDDKSITRRFLNGMFDGNETVSLEPLRDGVNVSYVMNYQINGFLNKILWPLVFERLHNRNIEEILANLKSYLEKR